MTPANSSPPSGPPRFNVLGLGVSALSLEQATDFVVAARGQKHLGYISHATAYGANAARSDSAFRAVLNGSVRTHPDGMPLVWLGRRHGHKTITRVYGPDLMAAVCAAGRSVGLRHYLFGGVPGVADLLKTKLAQRFPGLEIVGTYSPPFRELTPGEFARLQADVATTQPDIIWVGLSSPKQEFFMAKSAALLDAGLLIGVGAAFDFHSGRVNQAPRWMQRSGLEWFFRLCTEPRRLWKRYVVGVPLFTVRAAAQLIGLRKYPLER